MWNWPRYRFSSVVSVPFLLIAFQIHCSFRHWYSYLLSLILVTYTLPHPLHSSTPLVVFLIILNVTVKYISGRIINQSDAPLLWPRQVSLSPITRRWIINRLLDSLGQSASYVARRRSCYKTVREHLACMHRQSSPQHASSLCLQLNYLATYCARVLSNAADDQWSVKRWFVWLLRTIYDLYFSVSILVYRWNTLSRIAEELCYN